VHSSEVTKYLAEIWILRHENSPFQIEISVNNFSAQKLTMMEHPSYSSTVVFYEFSCDSPNREFFLTGPGFEAMWRQYVKDFLEIVSGNTSGRGRDPVPMRVKATKFKVTMLVTRWR
jgi:hypothetical protein